MADGNYARLLPGGIGLARLLHEKKVRGGAYTGCEHEKPKFANGGERKYCFDCMPKASGKRPAKTDRQQRTGRCAVEGCQHEDLSKGLCRAHYQRTRYKQQKALRPPPDKPEIEKKECPACRGFFTPNAKGGREHKYCSLACSYRTRRGNKPRQLWPLTCTVCAAGFESLFQGAIYCSGRCKQVGWELANPERAKELARPKLCVIHAGYCQECDAAYVARRPRKYCSDACAPSNTAYVLGVHYVPPVRTCVHCNCKWSAVTRMGAARFCPSPDCQAARSDLLRKLKSGKDYARESRKRGLEYEHFDPIEVLERDGWTCQLCGIATPPDKRGTYDPCAPELDHRDPRGRGGAHTRANTQCLCRSCNGWKRMRTMEEAVAALLS